MAESKPFTTEQLFKSMNDEQKGWGKGTVRMLAEDTNAPITHWTSTGCYELDEAMNWGLPGGRIVEMFGAESSGKTTELMAAFIENKRRGGLNVCFDAEGTFDQDRYIQMGGNPKDVLLIDPGTLEDFYDKVKMVMKWAKDQVVPHNACVLVGVDTIAMVIPKALLEAEGDDEPVAVASRVNSRHLPTVDQMIPPNTCLVLLNQVRDKVGSMAWSQEGNIETPGGRIIKFLSSTRVLFNKQGQVDNGKTKEDRVIIGIKTGAKVVKCKIGAPLRKCEFNIMFDERGVDNLGSFLKRLVTKKLIKAPSSGVYTVVRKMKDGDREDKFKAADFAQYCKNNPKWVAKMLDAAYELAHPSIDVDRYLSKPVVEE